MLTCSFQLNGNPYTLKAGDRVVVVPAPFSGKHPVWLRFYFKTAEGTTVEVVRNGELMNEEQPMGLPVVHDNNIREFISLLTGFSVSFVPKDIPKETEWCVLELHER